MRYAVLVLISLLGLSSCAMPEGHVAEMPVLRPSEVSDFGVLYRQSCSGCHGLKGEGGLAVGIGTPAYLAIADVAIMRRVIEAGRPGTAMSAFAQKAGGMMTDAQIDIVVRGLQELRPKSYAARNAKFAAYRASTPGDPARGQKVFASLCSSCHGADGRSVLAIADVSYLALVSDQYLRTVIITGMPHLGMPDSLSYGTPMSDADITDMVTWLVGQREAIPATFESTKRLQ